MTQNIVMNIIFYPRFILLHLGLIFSILLQAKAFGFYMCIFWISFDIIMGQNMKMGAVCLHKCRRYQKSTFPLVIHSNIPMKDNNCKLYIGWVTLWTYPQTVLYPHHAFIKGTLPQTKSFFMLDSTYILLQI